MLLLATVILVLGLIGANILRKHLREAKLLRMREISHQERMAAMEKELPLPERDDTLDEALAADQRTSRITSREVARFSVLWLRMLTLWLGLAAVFGGLGTCVAMMLVTDPEINGMWAMGLIPTFIGVGLLGFFAMSGAFAAKVEDVTDG